MVTKFFEFAIKTNKREEIIDITERVKSIVEKAGIKQGIALIYVPHATASIIINENYDANVCKDILAWLKKQVPKGIWLHDAIDNNGDSHIKASLLGSSQIVPFKNGKLLLGTWQGIGFVELDGPRQRKIYIMLIGE